MGYFDPNFYSLEEYTVSPPTVSVDNDTYPDHTVVKVNGANRHGILLDIVQAITDLDLIISKSTVSADGEWIMNVFHVTDELGNKMTDPAHIRYIEQSLMFAERRGGGSGRPPDEVTTCLNNLLGAGHLSSEHAVLEMTVTDHPGLLSEVLATLLDFSFEVNSAVAWAHNGRAGFIFHGPNSRAPTTGLKVQLRRVVEAHCIRGIEKWQLEISGPSPDRAHSAERRLHQIMREDNDWEGMAGRTDFPLASEAVVTAVEMEVSVRNNYMVEVNVRSRDRPKLVFDVVCTLQDLDYDVVHASVSTEETIAVQEYYIKKRGGWSRLTEMEKGKLVECLMAAIERRPGPWWMRLEVRVLEYRDSLLWEITRVIRENGMLVLGAKWDKKGELAAGIFYVKGGSSSGNVARRLIRWLRNEIGGCDFEIKESNNS
ncbi:starch phosphorylase [Dendrobium catenatum]|uniref:ACT domain-containing protein ACR n=2 Tax=Dendrobium catenatum TaxID=906689 RepID=A0A2I0X6E8_9ASPA|nr:starch phosphorylase [Dendrobium catenatum]